MNLVAVFDESIYFANYLLSIDIGILIFYIFDQIIINHEPRKLTGYFVPLSK